MKPEINSRLAWPVAHTKGIPVRLTQPIRCSGVYIAECERYVKIGFATDVRSRIALLQTGNPFPIVLIGFIPGNLKLERSLHREFYKYRTQGEWFQIPHYELDMLLHRADAALKEFDSDYQPNSSLG